MSLALVAADHSCEPERIRVCPVLGCTVFVQGGAVGLAAHSAVVHPQPPPVGQLALFDLETP